MFSRPVALSGDRLLFPSYAAIMLADPGATPPPLTGDWAVYSVGEAWIDR